MIKESNPQDEVFIVDFNDVAYLDAPFTNNIKKLEQVLEKIDTRGGTAMRDAISMSIDYAKANGKKSKKVLLVITDGNDNASDTTLEQLVRKARQSEVLIYCIGLLNEEVAGEARAAKRALKALAEASGGLDYYPKSVPEVESVTPQIAHEIRNQSILAYTPLNAALDGTFRAIKVTVKAPGHLTVRTRNGYFASPAPTQGMRLTARRAMCCSRRTTRTVTFANFWRRSSVKFRKTSRPSSWRTGRPRRSCSRFRPSGLTARRSKTGR